MNSITMKIVADKYIRLALEEDINSEDVSTNAVMPAYQKGEVQLICKQDGIIAGLGVFERTFQLLDPETKVTFYVADGDAVKKGDLMVEVDLEAIKADRQLPGDTYKRRYKLTRKQSSILECFGLGEKDIDEQCKSLS